MPRNYNFNISSMSRLAYLLFVLLNVVLVNDIYMPKASCETHLELALPIRRLCESEANQVDAITLKKLQSQYKNKSLGSFLDYLCKLEDMPISAKLMALKITLEKIIYSHIKKKDIDCVLDGFNELQSEEYKKLSARLIKKLNELSSHYGMSEKETMDLWYEYYEEISREIEEADYYYERGCSLYMKKKKASAADFVDYLYRYVKFWVKSIERNERKWVETFTERTITD
ncbi:RAD protein [Plasmodium cynomolgi strain B]|uniref:RAD protein n=1 Tax=Plasmodium cynomolgi (strain B) TaxID=1120755 RepID=K6UIS5_PLACD|nr:RAD protein [Plasmodium cynomolgi strain B]GAB65278.1 RAD protein [Plasmodium cynomolgi strain B]